MKWITREGVKVDRVACPWLIQKFIDPQAQFIFAPSDKVMEVVAREGATPMMKAFGIKVTRADGGAVGGGRAFGRLLMIVLVNLFTCSLGHVVAFFDKERRALHDMVCGTVVIKG